MPGSYSLSRQTSESEALPLDLELIQKHKSKKKTEKIWTHLEFILAFGWLCILLYFVNLCVQKHEGHPVVFLMVLGNFLVHGSLGILLLSQDFLLLEPLPLYIKFWLFVRLGILASFIVCAVLDLSSPLDLDYFPGRHSSFWLTMLILILSFFLNFYFISLSSGFLYPNHYEQMNYDAI